MVAVVIVVIVLLFKTLAVWHQQYCESDFTILLNGHTWCFPFRATPGTLGTPPGAHWAFRDPLPRPPGRRHICGLCGPLPPLGGAGRQLTGYQPYGCAALVVVVAARRLALPVPGCG